MTKPMLEESDLAVLALEGIADSEAGDTVLVWLSAVDVQEGQGSVASGLRIHPERREAGAAGEIVGECDARWEVGGGIECARSLSAIKRWDESVLEDPVGASGWVVETLGSAVAGAFDTVLEVQVLHGHDPGDVDTGEVAHATSIRSGSLKLRELPLGDLARADSVVLVLVGAGEVDVWVGVIILIADLVGRERRCHDGGGNSEDGENGGG